MSHKTGRKAFGMKKKKAHDFIHWTKQKKEKKTPVTKEHPMHKIKQIIEPPSE